MLQDKDDPATLAIITDVIECVYMAKMEFE
jgi:hypothetical protein